mgnify:CR=1 FL=1
MIISLKTDIEWLNDFYKPPIIGAFIILLVSVVPVPILFIINGIFDIVEIEVVERVTALFAGVWNIVLTFFFKTKISILFVPCWILFTIIGILRLFSIIG